MTFSDIGLLHILRWVSVDDARAIYAACEASCAWPNRVDTPYRGPTYPIGTWRYSYFGGFEVRIDLDPWRVELRESEVEGRRWPGYAQYVAWARDGYVPPPIRVVRHMKGHLVSLNRRRVLAARDAGRRTIPAWFSDTDPGGRARWVLPVREDLAPLTLDWDEVRPLRRFPFARQVVQEILGTPSPRHGSAWIGRAVSGRWVVVFGDPLVAWSDDPVLLIRFMNCAAAVAARMEVA